MDPVDTFLSTISWNDINEETYNDLIKLFETNDNKKNIGNIIPNYSCTMIDVLCMYKSDGTYTEKLLDYMLKSNTSKPSIDKRVTPLLNNLIASSFGGQKKQNIMLKLLDNNYPINLNILLHTINDLKWENSIVNFTNNLIKSKYNLINTDLKIDVEKILVNLNKNNYYSICNLLSLIQSKTNSINYEIDYINENIIGSLPILLSFQKYELIIILLNFPDISLTKHVINFIFNFDINIIGKVRLNILVRTIIEGCKNKHIITHILSNYIYKTNCDDEIVQYMLNNIQLNTVDLNDLHQICTRLKPNINIDPVKLKTIYECFKYQPNIKSINQQIDELSHFNNMNVGIIIVKCMIDCNRNIIMNTENIKDIYYRIFHYCKKGGLVQEQTNGEILFKHILDIYCDYDVVARHTYIEKCIYYNMTCLLQILLNKGISIYNEKENHINNILNYSNYYSPNQSKINMLKLLVLNGFSPNNKEGKYNKDVMLLANFIFKNEPTQDFGIILQLLKSIIITTNDYIILGSIFNCYQQSAKYADYMEIQELIQKKFMLLQQEEHNKRIMDDTVDDLTHKISRI